MLTAALGATLLAAAPVSAATIAYTYDEFGRLKTATYPDGKVVTYSYDAAGNRTQYVAAVPTTPLTASTSVTYWSFYRQGGNPPEIDDPAFITASGGVAPYTYAWEYVTGHTAVSATDPTSQSTEWVAFGIGTKFATWRGKVTDAASNVAYTAWVDVEIIRAP